MCTTCLTAKIDRDPSRKDDVRCRLCKTEGKTAANYTPNVKANGTARKGIVLTTTSKSGKVWLKASKKKKYSGGGGGGKPRY
jgi:hypothetical protein